MKRLKKIWRKILLLPRKNFKNQLKEKLLQEFKSKFTPEIIRNIDFGFNVLPRKSFSESLKRNILVRFFNKYRKNKPLSKRFCGRFLKTAVQKTVAVTAGIVFFFANFFSYRNPLVQAGSENFLSKISGEVFLIRDNDEFLASPGSEIFEKLTVKTENGTAEITFFEDSILRLAENSEINIKKISPNSFREDLGEVEIDLQKGKIWVRTFVTGEKFSNFKISNGSMLIFAENNAAIEFKVKNYQRSVRVWDQAARIFTPNFKEFFISSGQKLLCEFSDCDEMKIISEEENNEKWVIENQLADSILLENFTAEKILQQQKKIESMAYDWELKLRNSLPESSKNFFLLERELDKVFRQLLLGKNDKIIISSFEENCRVNFEQNREDTLAFLASAEKVLLPVLPNNKLFPIKESIEKLQIEFSEEEEKVVKIENQKTKRLWEANQLAKKGDQNLANEIIQKNQTSFSIEKQNEDNLSILEEKEKQIAILQNLKKEINKSEIVEELESETISQIYEIVEKNEVIRPGFPTGKKKKTFSEKKWEIINKIKDYSFLKSQQNVLFHELENIDNSVKNLELITAVREKLPENLHSQIDEKILQIVESERSSLQKEQIEKLEKLTQEIL